MGMVLGVAPSRRTLLCVRDNVDRSRHQPQASKEVDLINVFSLKDILVSMTNIPTDGLSQ